MRKKKYLITFSGGKDSLAIILWAKDNLRDDEWDVVFCDTGWEAAITYAYIAYIEEIIGKKFIRLKTSVFDSKLDQHLLDSIIRIFGERNVFAEMVLAKGRFPSTRARFCTEKLKVEPVIDYILSLDYDVIVVQGVRAEESESRRLLKKEDEYFKFYFEPKKADKKGKPVYDTYRRKDVQDWCDRYSCDVLRPILTWTHVEVFDYIFSHGLKPNPLYYNGFARVGCYPCVMCQLGEIKIIAETDPKRIEQLEQLEQLSGSSFFPPEYIPVKHCSKKVTCRIYPEDLPRYFAGKKQKKAQDEQLFAMTTTDPAAALYEQYFKNPSIPVHIDDDGDEYILRKMKVPTIRDVVNYVTTPGQQLLDIKQPACISVYNICDASKN